MIFNIITSGMYEYIVYKQECESNDQFNYRCKYIINNSPKTEAEFNKSFIESVKMRNIKFNQYIY